MPPLDGKLGKIYQPFQNGKIKVNKSQFGRRFFFYFVLLLLEIFFHSLKIKQFADILILPSE